MQHRALSLVLAMAAVLSNSLTHAADIVELDLIFPRNETYRPIYPFPIVFALRNPAAIWPFDFTMTSKMEWWSHEENRTVSTRVGFDQLGHFPNSDSGAYDDSPMYPGDASQPLYIINASVAVADIKQNTKAVINWEFGLGHNCTPNAALEDTVGSTEHFKGSVGFSFSGDGAIPSFNRTEDCPAAVGAYSITGQMEANGVPSEVGTCPILYEQEPKPKTDPCALTIDEKLATSVAEAMMASISCDASATKWPNPTATSCEQLSMASQPLQSSLGWATALAIIFGLFYICQV